MKDILHKVESAGMGQPTFEQCWLASYRMMFKYWKRDTSEIETKLKSVSIDVKDCLDHGMPDTLYAKAASTLGLEFWAGTRFKKPAGLFDFGLSDGAEAFLQELELGPLWVSKRVAGGFHIIVAYGYQSGKILCMNPFPGPSNAIPNPPVEANLFVSTITAASGSVQAFRYRIGN